LKRGKQITSVVFPPKGDHAAVTFDVNLHSVSSTIGEVDNRGRWRRPHVRNEPEQWVTMVWPGKTHGARLQVRGAGALNETIADPATSVYSDCLMLPTYGPGEQGGARKGLRRSWPPGPSTRPAMARR